MPNAEHLADAIEAVADIQADGTVATLFVSNPAETPAWDPDYSADTGTTIYVLRMEQTRKYSDDNLSVEEVEKIMIARSPVNLVPAIGDDIQIGNVRKTIILLKPFSPADTVIFWDAEIARG
jgi:hypothetical protein